MSEQNKWDKYKADSEETKTESTTTENKWDKYAVDEQPVKKKVDTTPSQSGSAGGISKSTTGVSAQPIQKISDFAPQGSKPLQVVTPLKKETFTSPEIREQKKVDKSINQAEKMQGVDKFSVIEKVNQKASELNGMIDQDNAYLEQVNGHLNGLTTQFNDIYAQLNAEKSYANQQILKQKAAQLNAEIEKSQQESKKIEDSINKKEIVAKNLYRATSALKEVDEKEQLPQNFGEELYESLKSGSAQLGSSIAKVPGFIYDIAAVPQNIIAEKTGLDIGTTSKEFAAQQLGIEENQVANYYDKILEDHQKEVQAKYDKGVTEYFANGEISKGLSLLANQVVESAPVSISLMVGGAGGLGTIGSTLGGGVVFGAQNKSEYDKDSNLTESEKTMNALSKGLFEGMFESFGITKLGGIAKGVLENEGKEVAMDFAKQTFKETYMPIATKYLGNSAEEIVGEAATQFAQNAVDKYSGAKPNINLLDGVADAAIVGFGSSGLFSTPVAALDVLQTKSAKKGAVLNQNLIQELSDSEGTSNILQNKPLYKKAVEIANNPQEMELFQKQLDREVKSGEITIDEANNTMNAIQAIAETETLIPPTIKDKDSRLAAVNIIAEKRLLEQQIEGKEKGLVEPQVERIKALDEGLKLISRGTAVEEVQNFLKPTETITESALGEQLTTPTETINEEVVETPVTEQVTEEVVPQELTESEPLILLNKKISSDAYSKISDIENNSAKQSIGEYISALFGGNKKTANQSEYYFTNKKINGKDVIIRVSDHYLNSSNIEDNEYVISLQVNEDEKYNSRYLGEQLKVEQQDNYVNIEIPGDVKNLDSILEELETKLEQISVENTKKQQTTLESGVQIEYSKNGGKTFERGTIQANENGILEVIDEDGTPNRVDTNKENTIINPIKTEENAVNQGNIEQSNQPEYQGIVGQEQGQQENRLNQEAVIQEGETSPSNRDFSTESGQVQEVEFNSKEKKAIEENGENESEFESARKYFYKPAQDDNLPNIGEGKGEEFISDESNGVTQLVEIKDLIPTQFVLNKKVIESKKESENYPVILRNNNDFFIMDGHHGLAASIENGEKEVYATIYDVTNLNLPTYEESFTGITEQPNKQIEPTTQIDGTETQELSSAVFNVPLTEIDTDTKRFQNRKAKFSENSVKKIVENFDPNKLGAITLWKDPKDGKTYVISGHSRLEAHKQLGKGKIKAEYFNGTEQEAIDFGRTSNVLGTQETLTERANYYRGLRESGKKIGEIEAEAKKNEGANAVKVVAISYLNPNGGLIQSINQMEGANVDSQNALEKAANWIGDARRRHPELTDAHEQEMYDLLIKNDGIIKIKNKVDFGQRISNIAGSAFFNPNEPLNLEQKATKGVLENEVEDQITTTRNRIKELEKERADRKNPATTKRLGEISDEIKTLNTKLGKLNEDLRKAREGDKLQVSLFDQIDEVINKNQITDETANEFINATEKIGESEPIIKAIESKAENPEGTSTEELNKAIEDIDKEIGATLADRTIAALEYLKIKSKGAQSNILGVPIYIYNMALDTIILGIKAGKTLKEALQEAIIKHNLVEESAKAYNLTTDSQKAKVETRLADELEESVYEAMGKFTPPTEVKPAKKQGGEERELSGFESIKSLYKDKSIQDKLANTPNPLYTVMKNEETVKQVDKLIDKHESNLENILLDKVRVAQEDIPNSVRVVAMVKLANAYMQQSKNDEFTDPNESKVNYDKAVNLLEKVAVIGKEYGQGIQAFANVIFGYGDFESAMFQFRKKIEKSNEKSKKEAKEKSKKDVESISSDIDMAAQEAVEEVIKKYKPRKKKTIDEIKAVRKSIKAKLKSSKNKYFNSSVGGITLEGIKLSGELAKTYIEEGIVRAKDIIEKIKQDFLDEGYKITEADEKKINSEIGKVSLEVKLSTMDETLTQIAKQHYDTRKKKTKSLAKTIVDELGLTDIEAEQIAKEIEAEVESKLKDKLQKRFKKELKTAEEKKDKDLQEKKRLGSEYKKEQKGNDLDLLLRAALDGTINEDLMQEMFKEKYGIADINQADIDYIKEQYANLDKLKDKTSFIAFEFYGNIFTRILSKLPQSNLDGFDLLWYSSTLSGPATQLMNATFGAIMSLNIAAESIVSAVRTANKNKLKNPTKHYGKSIVEWWKGAGEGLDNARYIFKHGSSSYSDDITQLEKTAGNDFDFKRAIQPKNKFTKGATFLFEQAKYPLRTLAGTDVFFTKAVSQSQIARLAELKYAKEGFKGEELAQKVIDELLVKDSDLIKYDKQAVEEVNVKYPNKTEEEIRETLEYKRRMAELKNSAISADILYSAENLAKESLLTRTPEGTPGQVYKVIASINNKILNAAKNQKASLPRYFLYGLTKILPFIKVPLNVIDLGYATSPLGFTRLINGKLLKYGEREMFLGRREAIINRAILGVIITAAIALLNAEDLWGEGLEGEEDKEKRNKMKKELQDRYFEEYGERLPLDHPLFNIPHEGQVSGSLSMLPKERRDFLTKNNLAKEQATFIGGKWISNTLSPQWAILGVIGTLVNYNRYIVNNPYTTTSKEENKKSYLAITSHVLGGLTTQFLEMSSLKGSQTLATNLDFKNGDPFEKMIELSRTTILQPLNILNPAIVRQTYKYFDQASVEKATKERDKIGLALFATQSFIPIVGAPLANYFSVERHDILGRTIKAAPGEGKDILGTTIGYARDFMNEDKNKEGDKIIKLLYMTGVNGVPNFPDKTLYKIVGKKQEIVEIPFRERMAMDKLGKQMAAKEMELRFKSKGIEGANGYLEVGEIKERNGEVIVDNSNIIKLKSLSYLANEVGPEELSQTSDEFSQEINLIYNKYYNTLLKQYTDKNGLTNKKDEKPKQ